MPARTFQPFLVPPEPEPDDDSERGPLTVSALTATIKALLEDDDLLQDVRVKGELSNVSRPASGHVYFTLKDGGAQVRCAMWRSAAVRLGAYRPKDGDAVIARGRIGVYERDGNYQLYVEALAPQGAGNLNAELERLKAKLLAEGLFESEHKRPLPGFPMTIGVVTSATAAAFQDILNVLRRRWPCAHVILAPTLVQGNEAPPQIVRAIAALNADARADVILVARGGGSLEELWAFNDERVVRAVAASRLPVISGVGHEVDFTLTDLAADVRAPTPSAAAEMLTPDINDIRQWLDATDARLLALMQARLASTRTDVQVMDRALRALAPRQRVAAARQQLSAMQQRLRALGQTRLDERRARVATLAATLGALSPQSTLARGYAIVHRADGRVLRVVGDVVAGDGITVRVTDGSIAATVHS